MKQPLYHSILLLILAGMSFNSYGQSPSTTKQVTLTDSQRERQERNFYRKTLQVDSVKAMQVSQVQSTYKLALYALNADTSLNEAARRVRIKALMEIKNQKLRNLLSPAQQEKIIPSTERMPSKPIQAY